MSSSTLTGPPPWLPGKGFRGSPGSPGVTQVILIQAFIGYLWGTGGRKGLRGATSVGCHFPCEPPWPRAFLIKVTWEGNQTHWQQRRLLTCSPGLAWFRGPSPAWGWRGLKSHRTGRVTLTVQSSASWLGTRTGIHKLLRNSISVWKPEAKKWVNFLVPAVQ